MLLALILSLSGGALVPYARSLISAPRTSEADPVVQGALFGCFVLLLVVQAKTIVVAFRLLIREWTCVSLGCLAVASTMWSIAPETSIRRGIALLLTTFVAAQVAVRYRPSDIGRLVAVTMSLLLAASVAAVLITPEAAVEAGAHEGAWRGVFGYKNMLGRGAALAVVALTAWRAKSQERLVGIALLCSAFAVLVMSRSATALVAAAAAVCALLVTRVGMRNARWAVPGIVGAALILAGIVDVAVPLKAAFDFLGRDLSLTGRTVIWSGVLAAISTRPTWGHGYGAFWESRVGGNAEVWRAAGWDVPDAHNGYLDLLLDLGFVGFAIFIVGAGAAAFRLRRNDSGRDWLVGFMVFFVVYNIGERAVLVHLHVMWLLYSVVAMSLVRLSEKSADE